MIGFIIAVVALALVSELVYLLVRSFNDHDWAHYLYHKDEWHWFWPIQVFDHLADKAEKRSWEKTIGKMRVVKRMKPNGSEFYVVERACKERWAALYQWWREYDSRFEEIPNPIKHYRWGKYDSFYTGYTEKLCEFASPEEAQQVANDFEAKRKQEEYRKNYSEVVGEFNL